MSESDQLCAQTGISFYGSAVEFRGGPSAEDRESQPTTAYH